jgi:hypothetical protein
VTSLPEIGLAGVHIDPWCPVPALGGSCILFGFARRHPVTHGLSWMASKAVARLDSSAGLCRTASGRVYLLGREFAPFQVAHEGEEAAVAFAVLVGNGLLPGTDTAAAKLDRLWLASCKAARHLGMAPPARDRREVIDFMNRFLAPYAAVVTRR